MKIAFVDHHNGLSGGQRSISVFINFIREKSLKTSKLNYILILDSKKGDFYEWLISNGFESKIRLIKMNTVDSRQKNFSKIASRPLDILKNLTLTKTPYILADILKREKIDIVYGNSFKAGFYISICKLFLRIKFAFRVRTALDYSNHGWIDKLILNLSDIIFANSFYIKNTIKQKYHQKTLVIYNHLKLEKNALKFNTERNNNLNVLIVGRITERKRQVEAVNFLNKFPHYKCKFTFVGNVEENSNSYYKTLRKKIKECKRPTAFNFIDFTNDIHSLMVKYDVILLPSIFEPLSRVIIESMALGCILVTTNDSGNKELIVHGENGYLYNPGDLQALKNVFDKVSFRNNSKIQMNARATFEEYFNEEVTVKAELNALKSLVR